VVEEIISALTRIRSFCCRTSEPRYVRRLAATGILLSLSVASCTQAGDWLMLPLESRFPRWRSGAEIPYGIIALGGEDNARVSALMELGQRFPNSRLVLVGFGRQTDKFRAKIMAFGVDGRRLVTERESRNTSENALDAAKILNPQPHQRWILITSSWHMPRAVGCFRASGFDVSAYPVDPPKTNPRNLELAIKEWIGLFVYRLMGRTQELFPAP
jgi:uncharacterized SAM-binding protein YcdF (DUF218 family)